MVVVQKFLNVAMKVIIVGRTFGEYSISAASREGL
jgi:hypothetical protein